jgi:DHA1 family tetracycline resistance protein-like MFS transporter
MQAELSLQQIAGADKKRALGVIFLIMLMDVIGLSLLIPIAPYIVQRYSANAIHVTLLTVIYAAAQFIAAPFLGKISDRVGRRPVLLISVFGSAMGYVVFGVGGALWVLFLSRLIDGITAGNLSTATAYIADISAPEERMKNFTLIGMAFGFGFILGPAIGSAFSQISVEAPAFAAAGLSLLSVVLGLFLLPESLPRERRETTVLRTNDINPFASIGQMARKPGMARLFTVESLFTFAFNGVNAVLALYIVRKFNAQPWQIGLLFVGAGLATAVVQAALAERFSKRIGDRGVAMGSLFGQSGMALATMVTPSLVLLYPVSMLSSTVTGFMWSSLGALISKRASDREQGVLHGVNTGLESIATVLGPLCAGLVYDRIGANAPLWMGAIILALAGLTLLPLKPVTSAPQAE